ncbi:HWE histidine kinase domain-containing protein [Sphingomonas sp.]|uniref:HWE histidine kinase domain-containing protein n=1 Tax=Sphingomonas sp. TaxID=28214 RepID=UPI0031CF8189
MAVALARILFVPDELPWLLFIPATIAIGLVLGQGPGLLASALSTVAGALSIGSPSNEYWLSESQWVAALLFVAILIAMVMLVAALRESMRRSRALNAELVERERSAAEGEAFLASVLAASTDCIKVLDLDGHLTFMSEGGMRVMDISDFNDVRGCPWPSFLKEGGPAQAREALQAAVEGRSFHFEAAADTYVGTPKWWSISVSPIPGPDGRPARILSVSRDHTALYHAREQQRLLNGELSHRLKNVLTLVQSIANQTLRGACSIEQASAAFSSRLASLGRATDVLTTTAWQLAELHDVVDAGLSAVSGLKERISIDGPRIRLNSQVALALTLALHELATNATKYGALSNDMGSVTLRWWLTDTQGCACFRLLWQERDGPSVVRPTQRGFGSRMIERSLGSYFRGKASLDFPPEGVVFRIDAPLGDTGELIDD